jgi:hypothetical protein
MGRLKEMCVASYSMMFCATVIVYLCVLWMNPDRQTEAGRRSLDRTIIPTALAQRPCQHVMGENRAEMRYSTQTHEYNFVVSLHPSSADGVVSKGIREGLFDEINNVNNHIEDIFVYIYEITNDTYNKYINPLK